MGGVVVVRMLLAVILGILMLAMLLSGCSEEKVYSKEVSQQSELSPKSEASTQQANNSQSQPAEKSSQEEKLIAYIDIGFPIAKNWDADPEVDGIEIELSPKTKNDELVKVDGVVKAKLWRYTCTEYSDVLNTCIKKECVKSDKALLESWNIPITKDQFDPIFGATIRLEYEHYDPTQDEEDFSQGCLLVTFEAQGKSFSAEEDSVFLKD